MPGQANSDERKHLKESGKALDKAIKAYYKEIDANYNKFKRESPCYYSKTMDAVDKGVVKDFESKYLEHLKLLNKETLVDGHPREENTIYAFIDKSRNSLTVNGFEYSGYAYVGGDDAYIFRKPVDNKDYGVIAHEIALVLGLGHIFEMGSKEVNKKLDEKIKEAEKEDKIGKKAKKKSGEAINNGGIERNNKKFDKQFDEINKRIMNKNGYIAAYKEEKLYYKGIIERFQLMVNCAIVEENYLKTKNNQSTLPTKSPDDSMMQTLEYTKRINLNKVIELNMSRSLENFMDYDTYIVDTNIGIDKSTKSEKNENFSYRSFHKWQWDIMKNSKFLKEVGL